MIDEFKKSMINEFEKTNMGLMAYYVGTKISQNASRYPSRYRIEVEERR